LLPGATLAISKTKSSFVRGLGGGGEKGDLPARKAWFLQHAECLVLLADPVRQQLAPSVVVMKSLVIRETKLESHKHLAAEITAIACFSHFSSL